MSKASVLRELEAMLSDPGSARSGNYLLEHVIHRSAQLTRLDRRGLIEALREWIGRRRAPETTVAVETAVELSIMELLADIRQLARAIEEGTAMAWHDAWWARQASDELGRRIEGGTTGTGAGY